MGQHALVRNPADWVDFAVTENGQPRTRTSPSHDTMIGHATLSPRGTTLLRKRA